MGWKMIYLARRNPALAPEQFPQAWREHSALGAGCTNVRDRIVSVAQCSRILEVPVLPGASVEHDGVNLLALRDLSAATDIWNDAETLAVMRPDEPRVFATYVRNFTLVCEERPLRDVPRTRTALFGFLRRRVQVDAPAWRAFMARPATRSALLAGAFAAAGRVVHDAVHLAPPPGYEFDAILEWWFESPAAVRAAFGERDVREGLRAWACPVLDLDRSVFMFTSVTHSRP